MEVGKWDLNKKYWYGLSFDEKLRYSRGCCGTFPIADWNSTLMIMALVF